MAVDFFEDGPTTNPKKVRKGSNTPILDNFCKAIVEKSNGSKIPIFIVIFAAIPNLQMYRH